MVTPPQKVFRIVLISLFSTFCLFPKKQKIYIPKIKFLSNPAMRRLFSFNAMARKSEIAKKYSGR